MQFVKPKTFLLGCTAPSSRAIAAYVHHANADSFMVDWQKYNDGHDLPEPDSVISGHSLRGAEVLTSLYAKLCYRSLVSGHNPNVTRTRAIADNLRAVLESGHGSVLEHVTMNFVTTDCSRVFTHELVRHRTGIAFSQTSGRYVALDNVGFVQDPILGQYEDKIKEHIERCESLAAFLRTALIAENTPFSEKKKITSAIRRILPNGQANEIGWTANIRQLRHMIMMRTSRHAEWEMRLVFSDVFDLLRRAFPVFVHDAVVEEVDGVFEVTGMKIMPY